MLYFILSIFNLYIMKLQVLQIHAKSSVLGLVFFCMIK